jgi:hypothetical protein
LLRHPKGACLSHCHIWQSGEGPLAKAADDEPVFLLRAQDNLASDLVEQWATQASVAIPSIGGADMGHKVGEARLIADMMRRWPIHKAPD